MMPANMCGRYSVCSKPASIRLHWRDLGSDQPSRMGKIHRKKQPPGPVAGGKLGWPVATAGQAQNEPMTENQQSSLEGSTGVAHVTCIGTQRGLQERLSTSQQTRSWLILGM